MDKYLIPPDNEEIENAFKQAFSIIDDYDKKDILLVTPTKKQMHLMDLSKFLGAKIVDHLIKNKTISVEGISIRLESLQTFNELNSRYPVIIGIYSGKAMLDKMDDSKAIAVIAVPSHIDDHVQNWIDTWNPQIYGENKKLGKKELIDNCVVKKALKDLTHDMCRPHTAEIMIRSTTDKEVTVELFKLLRKYNESYDPDSIRKWAVREGWTSEGADDLKDISQKVLEGRRIKGSKIPIWTFDNIKEWRKECNS